MPVHMPKDMVLHALIEADRDGYRLEIIDGLGVWEVFPTKRHIAANQRILFSVRPATATSTSDSACECKAFMNLYVRFPDGTLRRPDLAIYCREPDEMDEAVTLVPEAVVEIVSHGSEQKDLVLSPPSYLRHGVKDVIVLDPYSGIVWHHRNEGVDHHQSPVDIALPCGCLVTV